MLFNVDGSALTNPRKAGFGGLVRNHDGTFQFGFFSGHQTMLAGWTSKSNVFLRLLAYGLTCQRENFSVSSLC